MRYIILFQESCPACSKVARLVRDISITSLEAHALEDPRVTALLGEAHLQTPDRASVLVIDDDRNVQLLSGWAMRRRLAEVVGWRRSGTIVRLLAAEWQARLARSTGSRGPTRRRILGGSLVGLGGWALMSGSAAASMRPGDRPLDVATPADRAEVEQALATAPVQSAIRTWGPVSQDQVLQLTGGGPSVLVLAHPREGILTLVDNSPGAVSSGNPTALSLGPAAEHGLRYYTVGGVPVADMTVSGARVRVAAVQPRPGEAIPDISFKTFLFCFVECLGGKSITAECANTCFTCGEAIVQHNVPSQILTCPQCAVCAGRYAIQCASDCASE